MMPPSTCRLDRVRPHPLSVLWMAAVVMAAMIGSGCRDSKKSADGNSKSDTEASIPVEVEAVRRGPIESTLRTFATLEAEQEVKVFARTANRVIELKVEEGDHVRRDDVLVRLDDANQKVAVAKAANSLDKSRQEFGRLEALHSQRLISDQAFADARFEVRQLELALEDAQRELDYTVIRAPITGTLTRRIVKLGDLVSANQHLFDLIDFTSTVARVYVPEKSLANLALGQAARVTATAVGDQAFTARVRRIAPVVDAKSGTVKVTIGFDDIGPLRPGMYVDVELILDTRADALLISKRALVLDGDQTYAFRLGADRRVERLLVEPRATDRLNVEPTSGFKEGDQVVIAGQTGLKNGAKVRLPGDPDPETEKKKDSASPAALSASRE
ncbi:MAG: efflux RND transporter periplasmic adaptor subunit [Verrucomicrobiales bacterium]|nr:efflux RND transporter periplasmic adaptor subunit [Verrucomicrobiales bacterium]